MKISFYGASDDLVEVDGCDGADEFSAYKGWSGDLQAPDGAELRIIADYDGVWRFSLGQTDEEHPVPDWPVSIAQHRSIPYSILLTIEAPDGTVLEVEGDDDDA